MRAIEAVHELLEGVMWCALAFCHQPGACACIIFNACFAVQEKLGGTQTHFRSIVTDDYLRVIGTDGTVFSMGDAATIAQVRK